MKDEASDQSAKRRRGFKKQLPKADVLGPGRDPGATVGWLAGIPQHEQSGTQHPSGPSSPTAQCTPSYGKKWVTMRLYLGGICESRSSGLRGREALRVCNMLTVREVSPWHILPPPSRQRYTVSHNMALSDKLTAITSNN